jgi:hypothetical protein
LKLTGASKKERDEEGGTEREHHDEMSECAQGKKSKIGICYNFGWNVIIEVLSSFSCSRSSVGG